MPAIDPTCNPLADLVAGAASRFMEELAAQAAQGAADMLGAVVGGWLALPPPTLSQVSGPVAALRAHTTWLVGAIAVAALLVAAGRIALNRDGREAGAVVRGIATMVVLTGAGVPAVLLATQIGDSYSIWILDRSTDGNLGEQLRALVPVAGAAAFSGVTPFVAFGISVFVLAAGAVQLLLLLGRDAVLILLAGLLPVTAAAGVTSGGQRVRDLHLTWLLGLIAYEPAAATIYAGAFWTASGANDLMSLLTGLVMICMAIVALPALMRLIAPAVKVVTSSGGSGTGAGAAVAAGAQVASGAIRLGSSPRSPGGTAPSTASPTGSGTATSSPTRPQIGGQGNSQPAGPATGGAVVPVTNGSVAGSAGGATGAGGAAAGAAVAGAQAAIQAGPAAAKKVGGTASGAVGDQP